MPIKSTINYQVCFLISGATIDAYHEIARWFFNCCDEFNISEQVRSLIEIKAIEIESDFRVYVFYSNSLEWNNNIKAVFSTVMSLIDQTELAYLFYRLDPISGHQERMCNRNHAMINPYLFRLMFTEHRIAFDPKLASKLFS